MNSVIFLKLIQNAALLMAMALIFDMATLRWRTGQAWFRQVVTGIILGLIGVALILTPWMLTQGIIFDTRSVLLGISGLFFGLIPTLIAMLITGAFRLSMGGVGASMGIAVVLTTGSIGLLWRHLRKKPLAEISSPELYIFGLIIHIVMLACAFIMPFDTALQVLSDISLPVLLIYPLFTALLGTMMANRLRRERTNQELKENQERLSLAVQASNIGFFDYNMLTGAVLFSPEWKRQIGYAVDEIRNDREEWESRVHPDDFADTLDRVNACIKGLTSNYEAEFHLRHKDGSYRRILARARVINNTEGKPERMVGCHVDITQQEQNQEAVLASERRFRGLAESSQDYIMLYDREYRHVYENPAALRVSGMSADQIIGKTHREAGFGDKLSEMWEAEIRQVFFSAATTQRLFEWEGAEGKMFLDWRLSPVFGPDGQVELVLGISRDITALKQMEAQREAALVALRASETKYRIVADNTYDWEYWRDEQNRFIYCSPSCKQTTGYDPAEFMSDPTLLQKIVLPEDRPIFDQHRCASAEGENGQVEFRIVWPDGSIHWLSHVCLPVTNNEGQFLGTRGSNRDITSRKRAEEVVNAAQAELQQSLKTAEKSRQALLSMIEDQKVAEEQIRRLNDELEQRVIDRTAQLETANQELEAFAYSVSHDLRAPLRAMDGFSVALLNGYSDNLDEQGRHYLDRVQEASRRMSQLINDLLNLSRVTRRELSRQNVDLSELAHEVSRELRSPNTGRLVNFDIAPGLTAQADPHLMKIVLENLMGNAYKFTSKRAEAHIHFGAEQRDGERLYYVRDNGVGFDMEYASKLFAPFQRLHGMQEYPGTGIGLVTVQRIIHRHGGRIWPEADVDQGATFYFTLGGAR